MTTVVQIGALTLWAVTAYKWFGPEDAIPEMPDIRRFWWAFVDIVFFIRLVCIKILCGVLLVGVFPLRVIRYMIFAPGRIVSGAKRLHRAWDLADENKVAMPKPGKKQRYQLVQNGKFLFTDKQLSKLIYEGLQVSKTSYPPTLVGGIVQLQARADNSMTILKGGKWSKHGGGVLVSTRSNSQNNGHEVNNFFDDQSEYNDWLENTRPDHG